MVNEKNEIINFQNGNSIQDDTIDRANQTLNKIKENYDLINEIEHISRNYKSLGTGILI